jgi:hypothetical protein
VVCSQLLATIQTARSAPLWVLLNSAYTEPAFRIKTICAIPWNAACTRARRCSRDGVSDCCDSTSIQHSQAVVNGLRILWHGCCKVGLALLCSPAVALRVASTAPRCSDVASPRAAAVQLPLNMMQSLGLCYSPASCGYPRCRIGPAVAGSMPKNERLPSRAAQLLSTDPKTDKRTFVSVESEVCLPVSTQESPMQCSLTVRSTRTWVTTSLLHGVCPQLPPQAAIQRH